MKENVNINEGLESLERILLMMKYDNKKTLSENYELLNEQQTLSSEEVKQQEKIWGEKIPNDKKTGDGIVEWQNNLSYQLLRQIETMKGQKGWTGVGGSGLLRAEGSDVDIKCKPGKFTTTGSLKGDIDSKQMCVNPYNDSFNPLYKPYNSKNDYRNILLGQIMSIQDANFDNLKGKILDLMNKIPTSPTLSGKIRSEDIHKVLMLPQIILPFMGPAGLVAGAVVSAFDAYVYYKDGDYTGAALAMIFGALDIGWLAAELRLAKVSKEQADVIIKAVKEGKTETLSSSNQNVLKKIADNKDKISETLGKNLERLSANNPKHKKMVADAIYKSKTGTKHTLSQAGSYGGTFSGSLGYEKVKEYTTPKGIVEKTKCGYDVQQQKPIYCNWDITKQIFGSSGSEEDNLKLKNAVLGGWIPYEVKWHNGEIVPNDLPGTKEIKKVLKNLDSKDIKLDDYGEDYFNRMLDSE